MVVFYFFKLLLIYLIVLIALYFIGWVINQICLKKSNGFPTNIFLNILIPIFVAFLLISSVIAIICTKGQTFQWVILLSLIGWFVFLRKSPIKEIGNNTHAISINNRTKILVLFIVSIFSFVFFYIISGAPDNAINIDIHYDFFYYSKLSSKLIEIGVENYEILLSSYRTIHASSLYHYTDLWFNGFIGRILSLSPTETLMFVTYPILLTLTLLGTVGVLFEKINLNVFKIFLIGIVILFGCSFHIPIENLALYDQAFFRFHGAPGLSTMLTKTLILFPSLFLIFYSLKRGSLVSFTLWVLIVMASYNTVIPVFAGGCVLVFSYKIYQVFSKKNIFLKQDTILAIIIFVLFLIFLVLYMNIFTIKVTTPINIDSLPLKSIIILFVESMISPWLVYPLTAIIIFRLIVKKRLNEFQLLLLLFLLGGQLAGTVFVIINHNTNNVTQALSNPLPPIIPVFTIFFLRTNPKNNYLSLMALILLTFSSFYNFTNKDKHANRNYSDIFKERVRNEINLNQKKVVWVTLNQNYNSPYYFYCQAPGSFILTLPNADYPLDISPYLTDTTLAFCNISWNSSFILCKDISQQPQLSEKIIADFLLSKKVAYLFVQNNTNIPPFIAKRISLVVTDEFTKDAFYKFTL